MPEETLSVVIITKNEEDKISRCLESIKWATEIVVVDDLSKDKTVEICQNYGAKVISHRSEGNFDRQRNIGIDNARGDWILQMDADEIVPENLKNEILKILQGADNKYVAYKMRRQNFFLGHFMKHGGWFVYYTKLFKKNAGRYIGKSVHETLQVDGETGRINEVIQHFPFSSIEQFIERQNFYTSIEARLMYEDKGKLPQREINYNLKIRPLKLFWKVYIKKKGFFEGMYGFLFGILNSWVHFLRWAKYWEICYSMEPGHNIFMDPRLIRGKKEEFDLNKLKAIHQDLTDYLGVPVEKIARDYWNKRETTDKEQQRLLENASTEKELLDYYRTTRQYLYELTSWEAQKSKQRESRKLYLFFRKFHVKKILDFGGGAGGLCIYLNNHGLSCDYLDVPGETYNFAKWRFNKYKIKPRVIGALKNISPLNYEAVIAYDVFEHIFDLVDTIRKINNWLIPGGYLISISTFSGRGIHLIKNEIYQNFTNFNDLLSNNGFEFWGRLKADHFSNLLNKIGFKYPLFSIRLSKKPKYGGNLIVHRKKPNLI